MRLAAGPMRSAKRSPSASSTVSVADVADRPDVSRGNSFVEVVIPSPCWFRGAAKPGRPNAALEDGREGRPAGRVVLGTRAPVGRTYAPPGVGRKLRHATWRVPVPVLDYAVSVRCGPGLATAPRTVATNAASAWSVATRPVRSSALAA